MISKILVALDGSEHANHALTYALDLAEKYSASITLLSVVHHTVYIPSTGDSMNFVTPQVIQDCMEAEKMQKEFRITSDVLKYAKEGMIILHALPKITEIDSKIDEMERAKYYQQAFYGVPVRMAIISLVSQ